MGRRTFSVLFIALFSGCAGPTTPFGPLGSLSPVEPISEKTPIFIEQRNAVNTVESWPEQASQFFAPEPTPQAMLKMNPNRQVLHDKMDLTVTVVDHYGVPNEPIIKINFNGAIVKGSPEFFKPPLQNKQAYLRFSNLRLRDDRENRIKILYSRDRGTPVIEQALLPPHCEWHEERQAQHTHPFNPSRKILKWAQEVAFAKNLNPALFTGLIAQESAFDPGAVSWAKAIGLTQVTPIADRQLMAVYPEWPRSPLIERYPAAIVKGLIESGQITEQEDWRLSPQLSILGGVSMLEYFKSYWSRENVQNELKQIFGLPEEEMTNILLASYHSGALRVRQAIKNKGKDYLQTDELHEAHRYIRRVKSYCYHFSQEGTK